MDAAVIWHEDYALHDTGEHPEGPDRVDRVMAHLKETDLWPRLVEVKPKPAGEDDIVRVHSPLHVSLVRRAAQRGGQWLDPDTYVSPRSFEIAMLSAGGAIEATQLWDRGLVPIALIRPPGHHAMPDRAMGFCLFNNIAIAAARLLADGYERVAIVDWDVHHGNGTQAAFSREPRVLFVSMHLWPFYPGTGAVNECGEDDALGTIVNIPLPGGCTDGDYVRAFDVLVEPIVRQYRPQAILVSAGEDIHELDPLGGMDVTEAGFAAMGLRCLRLAQELCEGRLAFILEGGYDRAATARSVEAVLRAVLDEDAPETGPGTPKGAAAIEQARETQAAHWAV
jgi:acetoin utilization deacetylase AcuC-like enzyme